MHQVYSSINHTCLFSKGVSVVVEVSKGISLEVSLFKTSKAIS